MVLFTNNVATFLHELDIRFSSTHYGNDFAQTAYINWHAQVMDILNNLDKTEEQYGVGIMKDLPYFGTIQYNCHNFGLDNLVEIVNFKLGTDNFEKWIHNVPNKMSISGWNNFPQPTKPITKDWQYSNKKTANGFDILWKENEYCKTVYNFGYKGYFVFIDNNNMPLEFTWVSNFEKDPQGIWSANAKIYNAEYLLKQDGTCIKNNSYLQLPHKERNVSNAEYNHYNRYSFGDNTDILGKIITEAINDFLRREVENNLKARKTLNENSIDRRINKLIKDHFNLTNFNEIRKIRANFLNLIPNARAKNEKWLCTVLQWYLNGDIPPKENKKLDRFLGWLHRNPYPNKEINESDWSSLPFSQIKQSYDKLFNSDSSSAEKENVYNNKVQNINGFTIRRIDSQEEARKLGSSIYNNEWCILDNLFDEQVDDCTCYIITNDKTYSTAEEMPMKSIIRILKTLGKTNIANELEDFLEHENVCDITECECANEYFDIAYIDNGLPPYDKYGLSAIVVLVGDDGDLYGVYSRYNIPNMYDGCILGKMELSQLINYDIDKVCSFVEK